MQPHHDEAKVHAGKHRIIVDLSFPPGASVNFGILRRECLGAPHSYSLPSVADLARHLIEQGQGAYIWSADVLRAYRQLRSDPLALPLFGIIVDPSAAGLRVQPVSASWVRSLGS